MRAVCAVLLMVMASDALRDMQGASTELSHSVKEVEQTKGDGICRAKPDKQTHKGICDFNRDDEYVCKSQYLFCDWVPAKVIPAHCEGRPEHPAHKGICDFNRNEEFVCKSQSMFCNWVPEKKVYEFWLHESGVRAAWAAQQGLASEAPRSSAAHPLQFPKKNAARLVSARFLEHPGNIC